MTPEELRARVALPPNNMVQDGAGTASLHKLADELAQPQAIDPYAPPRLRNQIAADMVPQLTRDAVLKMFEEAAQSVERARDAMKQMMIEREAEANVTAATLRELGALQAASIERASNFAYDLATLFKSEAEKVTAFRDEFTPGAKAAA